MMPEKSETALSPNADDIKAHLEFLFSNMNEYGKDGRFEINQLVSGESYALSDMDKAATDAVQKNKAVSVYVVPSVLDPDTPPFGRSGNDDFYASGVVWCDIDDPHDPEYLKALYAHCRPNRAVITATYPHRRIQLWWKLTEPLADSATLLDALTGVMQNLHGDQKVTKVCQPMRLAGTVNFPSSDKLAKGRIVEQTKYVAIHDNPVDIDRFLEAYPVKDYKQLTDIINTNTGIEYGSKGHGLNIDEVVVDGRETFAYKMIFASIVNFTRQNGAFPDAQEVFDDVWPVYSKKVASRSGDLEKDGRGKKMIAQKIKSKLRIFQNGGMARYGLGSLEDIVNSKPAQKQEIAPIVGETIKKQKFFYVNAKDISPNIDSNDFVQGLLTEGTISVVYGESNCGKTFFMSDLAFHIVQGKEWNGKRVEKGNVLYLCLEGSRGLDNRIAAYKKEHGVDLDGFLKMPCPVNFITGAKEDIPALVTLIDQANAEFNNNIKIVIIDTLARAMSGGDENSGVDMGGLVDCADYIKNHTSAHICFIHHTGKDKARGARGHSSLRAAVDTEIEISRAEGADYSNVRVPKQRDLEKDDDFQFKLKSIILGKNRHGEDVTSCVVEPYNLENDMEERIHKKIKSGKTRTAFDALIECIDDKGAVKLNPDLPRVNVIMEDDFKIYLIKRGVLSDNSDSARAQYSRLKYDLIENDLIVYRDGYIWPKA